MRKRIYEIIEPAEDGDRLSSIYDSLMIGIIVISLVPLCFKMELPAFAYIDKGAAGIFCLDYVLRWATADYKLKSKSPWPYVRYPFTAMAIIDLLSILPSLSVINQSFKLLRLLRMFRALRVFRVAKILRYSKNLKIILTVLRKSEKSFIAVGTLAAGYILVAALVIFNVEPDTFDNLFDAIYWATISLTTVGYGDIYPISDLGRVITMISSVLGIAIVALPAGIVTAGYMKEIEETQE